MFLFNWLVATIVLLVLALYDHLNNTEIPNEVLHLAIFTAVFLNWLTFGFGTVFFLCLLIGGMMYLLFRGGSELGLIGQAEPEAVFALWTIAPFIGNRIPLLLWAVLFASIIALGAGMLLWALKPGKPNLKALRKAQVPFFGWLLVIWVLLSFQFGVI